LIRQISATELRNRLESAEGAPFLLDVREPQEFAYCRLDGAVSIPLGELPRRAHELPAGREIVAICHHGMRSFQAAAFLKQTLALDVMNLQGGVAAWAREVNPSMKQY
jgi:rhodanese-related sulfurtransferase